MATLMLAPRPDPRIRQPIVKRLASSGFPDLRIDHQDGLKREGAKK